MKVSGWGRAWLLMIVLMQVASACGGQDEAALPSPIPTTAFEPRPVINLVVNDWTASAINVAIAEQLIEKHLSYPVVPTRRDDTEVMFEELAEGKLDAVLEVWPSSLSEREGLYFSRGDVNDLGPLGPVGRVGWFVPRYVIDENPSLATWEGFKDASAARSFATAETSPNGRLLGTNESYRQYDRAIIATLGLPLQLVYSGTEEATLAELARAWETRDPILIWWWTPTAAIGSYDLVEVGLPAPTDECVQAMEAVDPDQEVVAPAPGGVACGYPEDVMFKVGTPGLAEKAPEVDRFVRAFSLTIEDQVGLLEAVEVSGKSIESAAASWIAANEDRWRAWLSVEDE